MHRLVCYIALCFLSLLTFFSKGQELELRKEMTDSVRSFPMADSISQRVNNVFQHISSEVESCNNALALPLYTNASQKLVKLRQSIHQRIDSLNAKGIAPLSLQKKLDSLCLDDNASTEKYHELFLIDHIKNMVPNLDTLSSIGSTVNEKISDAQSVSTELGIGPLGNDLIQNVGAPLEQDADILLLPPDFNPGIEISDESKSNEVITHLPTQKIPGKNFEIPATQLPREVGDLQNQSVKINEVVQRAGDVVQHAEKYRKEIKAIKDEGLTKTEKLPELFEQQAAQLEEVKALQAQEAVSTRQLEKYKKLIEQYKEEKKIHEELKAKTKELATEQILKNQGKVDDAMKNIDKYKRKFSHVHDMRNLPKRAPNPLKDASWRERVVPGLTFQTVSGSGTWLEFDPQVFYKLNGNLSAGVGGMYRFSMNTSKLTFDDFGSMIGGKVFAQYHAMKGFHVRGEAQYVRWKPWDLKLTDPTYVDHTYVAAFGILKSYQIAKKLKGNFQTLYHFHWEGMDPYKPKVMVRLGFDLSLKKREEKHWEKKLKERKQEAKI